LTISNSSYIIIRIEALKGKIVEKDLKLDKLCKEFASLDTGEKDYIIGISKALAFSVRCTGEPQGRASGNQSPALQKQGGMSEEGERNGGLTPV
jgi:hypothetical protein